MIKYQDFLRNKVMTVSSCGMTIDNSTIHKKLFPFQQDLVRWAVMKGRCAIFADTGLGKTYMSLEWARLIGKDTIIVAPLSVARQTQRMAKDIDIKVTMARSMDDVADGINITNYEMIKNIDPSRFGAVVLDESSILKSLAGKTRLKLTEMFASTKYKLCCTATPAPNDIAEYAYRVVATKWKVCYNDLYLLIDGGEATKCNPRQHLPIQRSITWRIYARQGTYG